MLLVALVGKRRRMLDYLKAIDINRYRAIIKELGIRKIILLVLSKHKKSPNSLFDFLLLVVNQFIYCSIESKIAKKLFHRSSSQHGYTGFLLKLGIPLNKGAAAKCL